MSKGTLSEWLKNPAPIGRIGQVRLFPGFQSTHPVYRTHDISSLFLCSLRSSVRLTSSWLRRTDLSSLDSLSTSTEVPLLPRKRFRILPSARRPLYPNSNNRIISIINKNPVNQNPMGGQASGIALRCTTHLNGNIAWSPLDRDGRRGRHRSAPHFRPMTRVIPSFQPLL
jgi:hypothetical protein